MALYLKDPSAKLDYTVDWATWLAGHTPDDTIATSTWVVPAGLTEATPAPSNTTTTTTIWVSGGTAGTTYPLVNRITTAAGRVEDRTVLIRVDER